MRWKSEAHRYGAVAVTIHWTTALAIFGLLASGLAMGRLNDAGKTDLLRVHAIVGVSVLVLTLLRIAWWAFADRRPGDVSGQPRWQAAAAWAVHRLLYVVIIVMGISGIAMIALTGAGTILFGGEAGPLPSFHAVPPRAAHGTGYLVLSALIALHIGAALYHQFVRSDRLLGRMGIGAAPR